MVLSYAQEQIYIPDFCCRINRIASHTAQSEIILPVVWSNIRHVEKL
jgi:hypothetical protein